MATNNGKITLRDIYEAVDRLESKIDAKIERIVTDKTTVHKELYGKIELVNRDINDIEQKLANYEGKASMGHVFIGYVISTVSIIISYINRQ